ncbi:MAG: hypothetical protein AB7R69_02785 [Candidatus Babeliales bacterium]
MNKKKTIGNNPLEAYFGSKKEELKQTNPEKMTVKKKERITIHLPVDLIEKIKNAVFWEPGLTLTAFAEYAFEQALQVQEEKRGKPYPERQERNLKSGRPVL